MSLYNDVVVVDVMFGVGCDGLLICGRDHSLAGTVQGRWPMCRLGQHSGVSMATLVTITTQSSQD